jgi:hypothetical protein
MEARRIRRALVHAVDANLFLVVGDDHPPRARIARLHNAPEAHVAAGERLQLESNVLEDVREVRALDQSIDEPALFAP